MTTLVAIQARAAAPPWAAAQIHDTVAAIASERKFAQNAATSLFGRFLRFLGDRVAELINYLRGHGDARWIIAATIVLIVVVVVARVAIERQNVTAQRRRGAGRALRRSARTDYWTLANEDAAAGRYGAACHALYAAVLDELARDGALAFHASKTTGDYSRDLRRSRFPRQTEFNDFVREFDRAAFGMIETSADDYARVHDAAERVIRARAAA